MEISKDWTSEERLYVISLIISQINDSEMSFKLWLDLKYRLALLVSATPEFLELNRANILGKYIKNVSK